MDEALLAVGEDLDRLSAARRLRSDQFEPAGNQRSRFVAIAVSSIVVLVGGGAVTLLAKRSNTTPAGPSTESTSAVAMNETMTEICGTYAVVQGDSVAEIASTMGLSIDALIAANPPAALLLTPGNVLDLPCVTTENSAPATTAGATATEFQVDDTGLPFLVLDPPPAGMRFDSAVSGANGKDTEPPVLLVGWDEDMTGDGTATPITVAVPYSAQQIAPPPGADPIADADVDGWVWRGDGVTTACLRPASGRPDYLMHATSDDVPDSAFISLAAGLDPENALRWRGGQPPAGFIDFARQDADVAVHAITYTNDSDVVSLATLTDYPLNGLSLEPGTTVSTIDVEEGSAFAFTMPTADGGTSQLAYWTRPDGTIVSLTFSVAEGNDPSELIAEAIDAIRPATPAEQERFEDL